MLYFLNVNGANNMLKKQKNKKNRVNKKLLYLAGLVILTNFLFTPNQALLVQEPEQGSEEQPKEDTEKDEEKEQIIFDINQEIDQKEKRIEELQDKIDTYKKNIAIKQEEELTLENEISLIDSRITKKNFDIQAQETLIDKLELEIKDLEGKITEKENEIVAEKDDLAIIIRKMYEYDQRTYLEIAVGEDNFSDFFIQLQYIEELESETKSSLDQLKALRTALEGQKSNLNDKKEEVEKEKEKLEGERDELSGEKAYRDQILFETKLDEAKFQQLMEEVRREQIQANSEIADLEREMRLRLEEEDFEGIGGNILEGAATLSWPVNPQRGISCGFRCGDYPFKKWFQHTAIDIRIPQGSPVSAAAGGYVAIAKNAGLGYSYILIVHGDGLATVYGHLSQIDVVPEQFVKRGEIIGLSGGMPGLPGTGKFSTGPHLHFEVRIDGIPDDPMKYLPAIL